MNKIKISGRRKVKVGGRKKQGKIILTLAILLSLFAFPSFAENANNNNVESGTNNTVSGDANAWNLEDNSISFFEVPELVNHYSSIAEMEKDLISQSTKGMEGVKSAVKEQKADIVDTLSDNISLLQDQRDNTEDKTVKEALGKEIAKLEKVKNSKKILPGLDSSLVEANYALTELAKTDKEMTKAEQKTEKAIRSKFLTGKALLSDAMQNLLFSYMQTANTGKMLEKRVSLMQRSLDKIRKEQSLGKATANDVTAAELSLKSAEADYNKLRDGLDAMKRNIGLSLGWHMNTYQNITIEAIPDFPRDYLNGRDQEQDYGAVLTRNSEYGEILRTKEKNITGWTEKKQKEREKAEEIRTGMKSLWASVEEKGLALNMAETNASLSQLKKDKAVRMEAQGLVSRVDAEGMELDALSSENAYENARLDYNQAVFRYEEAVNKGILSLE